MPFANSEIELAKIPTLRSRSISTTEPDLEFGSTSVSCRICLEDDSIEGDELIAPCRCKGTQQFVHRQCLDRWRLEKKGFAFNHCTTCKAGFQLQKKEVKYSIVTRIKHKLCVALDVFLFVALGMVYFFQSWLYGGVGIGITKSSSKKILFRCT